VCGGGWRGGPGSAGFAAFGRADMRGLGIPRPCFVARPLSSSRARPPGRLLIARNAELLCAGAGSARAAPSAATGCGEGVSRPGRSPAEAGELAGDRDGDDAVGLVAGVFELPPAGVEPSLGARGGVDDVRGLAFLAALQLLSVCDVPLVVVGGLDQQPAGVEPALVIAPWRLLAGGVLRGHDPEIGGQTVRMIEALELADLGTDPQGGQGADRA